MSLLCSIHLVVFSYTFMAEPRIKQGEQRARLVDNGQWPNVRISSINSIDIKTQRMAKGEQFVHFSALVFDIRFFKVVFFGVVSGEKKEKPL